MRRRLIWAIGGLLLAAMVVVIVVVVNSLSSDMFTGREWTLQGTQSIEGRRCVRVYPGQGHGGSFLAVCKEGADRFSCWSPDETNGIQVFKWGRMEDDDARCTGAVSEVQYQTNPTFDPFEKR